MVDRATLQGVDGRCMREVLIETAKAKVNLTLRVLGRRPDGNHELESLVAFADVGDAVEFAPGAPLEVTVRGPFAGAIDGPNIAMRALELAREAAPARINAIAATDDASCASILAYLEQAPGVTGQYFLLDGHGAGNPVS